MSWLCTAGEYQLFFNRDENLKRRPALAPVKHETGGMTYLSPLDGDYGGTWIAVNESGLTLCLLNRYDGTVGRCAPDFRSRGEIIPELIVESSLEQMADSLRVMSLADYNPFTLVAFSRAGESWRGQWGGDDLIIDWDLGWRGMITSSSFATADVVATREKAYQHQIGDKDDLSAEDLRRFHASHDLISGARSVCLHRQDAVTVSLTRIYVTGEQARCWYYPSSPCAISTDSLTEMGLPQRR